MASQVQPCQVGPWTSLVACFFGPGGNLRHPQFNQAPSSRTRRSANSKHPRVGLKEQSVKTAIVYAATAEEGTETAASCSDIPMVYADPAYRQSTGATSTPHPSSLIDDSSVCMTAAFEMEAGMDTVLDGSINSAQALFVRYDMDLDSRLSQQDYYDLMLELNLTLPVQDYQQLVNDTFFYADTDQDCLISMDDFVILYNTIAAARQAFRHQDHHQNGMIDRYDFAHVLAELEVDGQEQGLKMLADKAFRLADSSSRGILNFGQVLLWYGGYLAAVGRQESQEPRSSSGVAE